MTGPKREFPLPDVPTLAEQGFQVTPVNQIFFAMTTPGVPGRPCRRAQEDVLRCDRAAGFRGADDQGSPAIALLPLTPAEIRAEHNRHRQLILAFRDELKK